MRTHMHTHVITTVHTFVAVIKSKTLSARLLWYDGFRSVKYFRCVPADPLQSPQQRGEKRPAAAGEELANLQEKCILYVPNVVCERGGVMKSAVVGRQADVV